MCVCECTYKHLCVYMPMVSVYVHAYGICLYVCACICYLCVCMHMLSVCGHAYTICVCMDMLPVCVYIHLISICMCPWRPRVDARCLPSLLATLYWGRITNSLACCPVFSGIAMGIPSLHLPRCWDYSRASMPTPLLFWRWELHSSYTWHQALHLMSNLLSPILKH